MSATPFVIPAMPRRSLLALVASLPHSYDTPHSRQNYLIEGFADDFGNIVLPGFMSKSAFKSRYHYFRGVA